MMTDKQERLRRGAPEQAQDPGIDRRDALRALGRFAAVTPPTVGLMLAAASRPVHAIICSPGAPDDLVCDEVPTQ